MTPSNPLHPTPLPRPFFSCVLYLSYMYTYLSCLQNKYFLPTALRDPAMYGTSNDDSVTTQDWDFERPLKLVSEYAANTCLIRI